ncbi:MAG TPA: universal stress protein [Anaeromyxobacteraceae bacterium]|nr:universal stress protein [Anaeromyxobacteraceae bacterium]
MSAWKKICCPVDLSPVSRAAMEQAAELAWRHGGAITLLYVDALSVSDAGVRSLAGRDVAAMAALERDRELETWRHAAAEMSTAPVGCAIAVGDPAAEIVRFARAGRHDVIVMGTHGRTDHATMGSVAQRVVLDAPCPVLVVNGSQPDARAE